MNRLYLIRPYCDKDSQRLIDTLIAGKDSIQQVHLTVIAIKGNIKEGNRLLDKLSDTSLQLDFHKHFIDKITEAVSDQKKCLKTAICFLDRYFAGHDGLYEIEIIMQIKNDLCLAEAKIRSIISNNNIRDIQNLNPVND